MGQRRIWGLAVVGLVVPLLVGTAAQAQFGGKLKGLGGGGDSGGGASWKTIVGDFDGALDTLAGQAAAIQDVIGDMQDALGDKKGAAVSRKLAESIRDSGSALGADQLDEAGASTQGTVDGLKKSMGEIGELNAKQKKAMQKAAGKYVKSLAQTVVAGTKLAAAGKAAKDAGVPSMSDGMSVLKVAKKVPTVVPASLKFIGGQFSSANELFKYLRENDIAKVKTQEFPDF